MEDPFQPERKELEYKDPNEEQGYISRYFLLKWLFFSVFFCSFFTPNFKELGNSFASPESSDVLKLR